MKNILKTLGVVSLMIWFTSCEDFLTEDPKGRLASVYFFQSAADLDASINALYYNLASETFSTEYYLGQNLYMGDDISSNPIGVSLGMYDRYDVVDNHTWMKMMWDHLWNDIKCCNFIINGAGNTTDVSDEEIQYTLAIAHYWRAYFYFYIVRTWGPIPIMLEKEADYSKPLCSVEEVYDLIVSDLKIAEGARIRYTKSPYIINGRNRVVDQASAKATLAYVYMTMAGWPLNKGTEYYQMAAAKAKEVLDGVENGTYSNELYDEYWKINSLLYNDDNSEVLTAVYYNRDTGGNGYVYADYHTEIAGGWNNSNAEIKFWYDYPAGPRKDATYFPKMYLTNVGLVDWWWDTDPPSRVTVRPCFMRSIEGQVRFTDYDWSDPRPPHSGNGDRSSRIIHLGEVYLWYAEAIGRAGQTNAKAIEYVNMIRNRADGFGPVADRSTVGVPEIDHVPVYTNIYPNTMNASELAEAAYNEHGWEIGGYIYGQVGARYWDMHRMNRVKDHFEFRKQDPMIEVAPGVFRNMGGIAVPGTWSDSKMYLPYPTDDVMLNPNLKR